jgi:predicted porin
VKPKRSIQAAQSEIEELSMKRSLTLTAAALSLTAFTGTAYAGSLADPVIDTPVAAPVPAPAPVYSGGDWTGFYTGLQLGYGDVDGPGALDGDNGLYGFHAGYNYDFGRFVMGGELDYDQTDIDLGGGAASVDSVARAKLKGGYDFGRTLGYVTAGVARADTSVGDETGPFAGLGMTYQVNERFDVGAEALYHQFDDLGGVAGADVDATTITLRGSYKF